ncbi:hypothetical protein J437_LFUL001499 [Ladona fulva]|uniref:EF-hand domain-containing protein n=1 Tax=Ladona fulva TaxID=123851 RepID=A0A8K0JWN8_LADFU|nr:hypothetical protein J437_LFUL001499 [Ladona fulva]
MWSDPSTNEGCEPNTLRGAGTYFGPDITNQFLEKHGLSLLVRSHECKLDGYELTHGDKVITIFSASNYYEVGSNKGAYLKLLGPELTPHFVQYTSAGGPVSIAKGKKSHLIGVQVGPEEGPPRQMTFRQRVGLVERSAIRELKGRILNKQDSLMEEFKRTDPTGTGYIPISSWCHALEKKTGLSAIPWRMLRDRLASVDPESGHVEYTTTFREESLQRRASGTTLVETLYRNKSSLEAIFKIIDTDNSGLISMEEFKEAWILLSKHLEVEKTSHPDQPYANLAPSPSLHQMMDVARTMDMNKDGLIDLNEFLEAFRLVDPGRGDEDSDEDSERED